MCKKSVEIAEQFPNPIAEPVIVPPIFAKDDLDRVIMPHRPTSTGYVLNSILKHAFDSASGLELSEEETLAKPGELVGHPFNDEDEPYGFVVIDEPETTLRALRRYRDLRHGQLMDKQLGRFVDTGDGDKPKFQLVLTPKGSPISQAAVVHQMIDELILITSAQTPSEA